MTFALRHRDVDHEIEARRVAGTADAWMVTLSGRERRVNVASAGEDLVMVESEDRTVSASVRPTLAGVDVRLSGRRYRFKWSVGERRVPGGGVQHLQGLTAPIPGLVLKVLVRAGDRVRIHQTLLIIEAMKMEHTIEAPHDGVVKTVHCQEGGRVAMGAPLVELEKETPG